MLYAAMHVCMYPYAHIRRWLLVLYVYIYTYMYIRIVYCVYSYMYTYTYTYLYIWVRLLWRFGQNLAWPRVLWSSWTGSAKWEGGFRIYDEPESPKRRRVQDIWWAGIAKWGGVFKIYDEPEPQSPYEGACLRYTMNRHRQMKWGCILKIWWTGNAKWACLRYMMNRSRQMRGCVWDMWSAGIATWGGPAWRAFPTACCRTRGCKWIFPNSLRHRPPDKRDFPNNMLHRKKILQMDLPQ